MTKKIPEITLKLETRYIEAKTYKLDKKWRFLTVNHHHLVTRSIIKYWFYKIWWKIKPPELKTYYNPEAMKELEEELEEELGKIPNEKIKR